MMEAIAWFPKLSDCAGKLAQSEHLGNQVDGSDSTTAL